jgi:hypothetical protein
LERLATRDKAHATCALVDDCGGNGCSSVPT